LPFSDSVASDDKRLKDCSIFAGKSVVVTEKMDGENTSLYHDGYHARSLDSRNHPSRNWLKRFHSTFAADIPDGWRICGENLYAQHSIRYESLKSYFYVFSIWDETNTCLDWKSTEEWCACLGLTPVPVIARLETFKESDVASIKNFIDITTCEGFVVRNAGSFAYDDFSKNCAKYVRASHVQTDFHWMNSEIRRNGLGS
jgi:ATP-dependent RNA circularization protein (DNA/RNA ligase family)